MEKIYKYIHAYWQQIKRNSKISWSNQVHHEKRVARAETIQSGTHTYTHSEPVDTWQSQVDQEHNAELFEFYTVTLDTFQ